MKESVHAMKRAARSVATFVVALCFLAPTVFAQGPPGDAPNVPAYTVARIKVLAGSVWLRPADAGEWDEATTNTPLTPHGRVSVPNGSEAELQFRGGQFVLLTGGTDLEAQEMEEEQTVFRLRAGEIRFDLPEYDFAPVRVQLPGAASARLEEPGRYWLTVTDPGTTVLVVRRGTATVSREGEAYRLSAGEEATIGREVAIGPYQGGPAPAPPLPQISDEGRETGVPPVVYSELEEYGEWVYLPTYGYAWRPRVATGWSPYVYGRWVWMVPYGWTWVSYEPWGWYPYHCGYWVTDPVYGWVWAPYNAFVAVSIYVGPSYRHYYYERYRYVPCNVRFIPEGRTIRWVPMSPGERYRPPTVSRDDARLSRWNRPLPGGRVFVRGGAGSQQRVWRDVTVVHAERQRAVHAVPTGGQRPDMRPVRPEGSRRSTGGAAPPPNGGRGPEGAPARKVEQGAGRPGAPQGGIPAPHSVQGVGSPRSEPVPRDMQRGAPRTETPHEPAPRATSPQAETPREPSPRSTAPRVVAPPAAPSVPSAPPASTRPEVSVPRETPRGGGAVERAPSRQAPEREYYRDTDNAPGGYDRGGGNVDRGSQGGYDRGGGGRWDRGDGGWGGSSGGGGGYDRGGGRTR